MATVTERFPNPRIAIRRKAILVCGMHRSGTSAATRVLSLLGADLSNELLPPNKNNPTGFWESGRLATLHNRFLIACGSRWHDWHTLDARKHAALWDSDYADEIQTFLRDQFAESRLFAIKDPRICRFVPLWRKELQALGADPVAVLPIRNPWEVAQSLKVRDGFDMSKSLLVWLRYVLDAERDTRGLQRSFLRYDSLLAAWPAEVERLSADLQLSWPCKPQNAAADIDSFLTPGLRHQVMDESTGCGRDHWIARTLAAVERIRSHGESDEIYLELDTVRAEFNRACEAFTGLVHAYEKRIGELNDEVQQLDNQSVSQILRKLASRWWPFSFMRQ